MKRFLALAFAALIGATTASACAQGFADPRGRDEGNGSGEQRGGWGDGRNQDQPKPDRDNGYAGFGVDDGRGDGGRYQQPRGNAQAWAAERQDQNDRGVGREQGRGDGWRQGSGRDQGDRHSQGYGQGQVHGLAGQLQPQNNGYGHSGWGNNGYGYGRGYGYDDHRNGYRWGSDWRRSWSHGWNGRHYRAPTRYYRPYGYVARSWSIGFRLPSSYYGRSYYVDYRPYGLAPPPWGCQWIRVDGDVLLVDLATGEVIDVLYGFYY